MPDEDAVAILKRVQAELAREEKRQPDKLDFSAGLAFAAIIIGQEIAGLQSQDGHE